MENFEQVGQKEVLSPQSSPKRKYLLIGVVTALVILIGGNVYQYATIANLKEGNVALEQDKTVLDSRIEDIHSKVEQLLSIQGIPCDKEAVVCLETIVERHEELSRLSEVSFTSPYPITWQLFDAGSRGEANLSIVKVGMGEISATKNLSRTLEKFNYYKEGEKVYAIVFDIKVTILEEGNIYLRMKRIVNEKGEGFMPNSNAGQFIFPDTGGLSAHAGVPYPPQRVIFVVPEDENKFLFSIEGIPNIQFTVTRLDDGTLKVEKKL